MNNSIRLTFAIFVLGLLALFFPQPVVAHPGVTFLGDQELSFTFEKPEEGTGGEKEEIAVEILNGTNTAKTITLTYVEMLNAEHQAIPSEALNIYSRKPYSKQDTVNIAANGRGTFVLVIDPTKFTGRYSGQLVIVSNEEVLDRRMLIVSVIDLNPPPPSDLDLLEEVTFVGKNPCPSVKLLALSLCKGDIQIESKPAGMDDVDVSKLPAVGEVAGANGIEGEIVKYTEDKEDKDKGENVYWTVRGISKAGEYTGKIDLTPDEEGQEVTAKVLVRDIWCWPLLVLVIGIAVSWLLGWLGNYEIPRLRLEIKFKRLENRACHEKQQQAGGQEQTGKQQQAEEQECTRRYDITGPLKDEIDVARSNFEKGWRDDELRKQWGPNGEEIKRITGYVDVLDTLETLGEKSSANWDKIVILLKGFLYKDTLARKDVEEFLRGYPSRPVFKQLNAYFPIDPVKIDPVEIKSIDTLVEHQDELSSAKIFIESFYLALHDFLNVIMTAKPQSGNSANADANALYKGACAELGVLLSEQIKNADHVQLSRSALQGLCLHYHPVLRDILSTLRETSRDLSTAELREQTGALGLPLMAQFEFEPVDRIDLRPYATSITSLEWQLKWSSLVFSVLSMIIVIFGALSALYWGKSSFGSPVDYAGMFLWATATDRIIKLIGSFLPNVMGNLSKPA